MLEKSEAESVRANGVIMASDLACRFPNLIEPWTPRLYARYVMYMYSGVCRDTRFVVVIHQFIKQRLNSAVLDSYFCVKLIGRQFTSHTPHTPHAPTPHTPPHTHRLSDVSCRVRRNTMTVLTHLILNDMVKVRGQISSIALAIEDSDPKIADLAKHFFHELASKVGTCTLYS